MSDIKSKEEILRKNIGLLPYINSYEKSNSIFKAMDEWGKQCFNAGQEVNYAPIIGAPNPKYKSYEDFLDHQLKQQV